MVNYYLNKYWMWLNLIFLSLYILAVWSTQHYSCYNNIESFPRGNWAWICILITYSISFRLILGKLWILIHVLEIKLFSEETILTLTTLQWVMSLWSERWIPTSGLPSSKPPSGSKSWLSKTKRSKRLPSFRLKNNLNHRPTEKRCTGRKFLTPAVREKKALP